MIASRILGLVALAVLATPTATIAADYWQVQGNAVTVIASAKRDAAMQTATTIVRLQDAVRWIAAWPADYRPTAVLAVALTDDAMDRYFGKAARAEDEPRGLRVDRGMVLATPQITVLVFTTLKTRGQELDQMQMLYGRHLLDRGPTAGWPECVRYGFSIILRTADLRQEHQLYATPTDVIFPVWKDLTLLPPRDFIDPEDTGNVTDFVRARRDRSCYTLGFLALQDKGRQRVQYGEYFRLTGEHAGFDEAAHAALGKSDAEFDAQLKDFWSRTRLDPKCCDILIDIGGNAPQWAEPELISPERIDKILTSLAAKIASPPAK